jgi:hypothetical protein
MENRIFANLSEEKSTRNQKSKRCIGVSMTLNDSKWDEILLRLQSAMRKSGYGTKRPDGIGVQFDGPI